MNAQRQEAVPGNSSFTPVPSGLLQRKCACGQHRPGGGECEECRKKTQPLQRASLSSYGKGAGAEGEVPSIVHEVLRSPGQPLEPAARAFFEPRFGHDFSQVRVHTDARAVGSARAVGALAYTVGEQITFGVGQYAPYSPIGRRLLAHELAHVAQQDGVGTGAQPKLVADAIDSQAERAADTAVGAVLADDPLPALAPFPTRLQRQGDPTADEAARREAAQAELFCNLRTLCRLRFSAPTIVTIERVRAAYQRCRPGSSPLPADPCLFLDPLSMRIPVPGATPGAAPSPSTAPGQSSVPSLSDLFTLKFGPVTIEAPKSVALKLPVAITAAKNLVIDLKAEASGDFSFSITLDGLRYVRVSAKAGVSYDKDKGVGGSAGLRVELTDTICHAANPTELKDKITQAGGNLKKAMIEYSAESDKEKKLMKLPDIASALGDMYDAVDKSKASCEKVPKATFEFGFKGPIGGETETDPSKRQPSYIGGTLTIPF